MENLKLDIIKPLNYMVLEKNSSIRYLLGMQLMAKDSEEGNLKGLSWFDASVKKFKIHNKLSFKSPKWDGIQFQ